MPFRIPESQRWMLGVPRNTIAVECGLSNGAVSSIVDDWRRSAGMELAVLLRDIGVSLFSVTIVIILLAALTMPSMKYVDARANLFEFDNNDDTYIVASAAGIFDIFTKPLEHSIEIDSDQIFPNETLKHEIISKSGPLEFSIPTLEYNLLGFNISATDIKVVGNAKKISDDTDQSQKTRIDFPVMLAKNVNVNNEVTNQKFNDVDLSSIYAIYDPKTDKFNFHIPFDIAARYLLK